MKKAWKMERKDKSLVFNRLSKHVRKENSTFLPQLHTYGLKQAQ